MKVNFRLFLGLSLFYFLIATIYYFVGGEAVGITCITLSGALAGMVGFYVWFNDRRMGMLPQDHLGAEIADGAGELGFYSPHSWWPLPVALSMCAAGLGLLVGWWLTLIAVGALFISIFGFTLEYEKPSLSQH